MNDNSNIDDKYNSSNNNSNDKPTFPLCFTAIAVIVFKVCDDGSVTAVVVLSND